MTTPACSPEFPWTCPPGIREQILRAVQADEGSRQRESAVWFDKWKRIRTPQPPQPQPPPQSPASSQKKELVVKKVDTYFKPPDLKVEKRELPVNLGKLVATPPPGVKTSWGPVVSPPRQKNPEPEILKALDETFKRLEEQRRREAELFERLDWLKSTRPAVPRLIELPEPPLAISPWRWALPKPIAPQPIRLLGESLVSETRRKVPA